MNEYLVRREKQEHLYTLYNQWYAVVNVHKHNRVVFESFKNMFKDEARILKTVHQFDSVYDIKKTIYKEIRHLTTLKHLAWRRYLNHLRFNLFCISVYRQTHVDVSFARHKILEYLHG